jgi:hypothetical protein
VVFYPEPGKERQIEDLLGAIVGELQRLGQVQSLWRRVYSSDGPISQILARYADLADLDCSRAELPERLQRTTLALAALARAPHRHRLTETVVPLSPR